MVSVILSICFTLWEHVLCLSRYLYSHYDMPWCHEKSMPACCPRRKKPRLSEDFVCKNEGTKNNVLCQWILFNILPLQVIKKGRQQQTPFSPLPYCSSLFLIPFSVFFLFTLKNYWPLTPPPLLLSCFSVPRIADKRNSANEPLKPLNGRGLRTMGQRMQRWTKAGPCPATLPCSDGSERTHERGLDLGLWRHHLAPHWANQKGQASEIHWNPSQGPLNNHKLLTSLAIHRPWLIWETHACFSIQLPPSLFIILKAWNYSPFQSQCYRLDVGSH